MYYTFTQNNSGGSFAFDERDGISHYVVVEADDVEDAVYRAGQIGLYFDGDGDCSCCGSRWYEPYDGGDAEPLIYGQPVEKFEPDFKWIDGPETFVHYKDGQVIPFHV